VLATIPFVLFLNSDRVTVTTRFYGDGSGIRQLQAEGVTVHKKQMLDSMPKAWPGFDSECRPASDNRVEVSYSAQVHDLGVLPDVEAGALDIVQHPLSLQTRYELTEKLQVEFTRRDDRDPGYADQSTLEYRLEMPGTITNAQGATIHGKVAVWMLNAREVAEQGYEVRASAVAWRWDVIVTLVYVLGYLTYRILGALAHRARLRPRKI